MTLSDAILEMIQPSPYGGTLAAGDWPADTVYAVESRAHDRQFPQVDHGKTVDYFRDMAELGAWLDAKREWIAGTDHDFSLSYKLYEWDFGPTFKEAGHV